MALPILMPALSPTMTEGTLVKWNKKEGDKVEPGQILAEVETDKAVMEIEAVDFGTIGKILVKAQSAGIKVNSLIAILMEAGDSQKEVDEIAAKYAGGAPMPLNQAQEKITEKTDKKPQVYSVQSQDSSPHSPIVDDQRVKASPLARKIAQQEGITLSNIKGTGPHGRIVKNDVLNAKNTNISYASHSAIHRNPIESELLPISGVRRVIATRLLESKQTIPHFYVSMDCVLDRLLLMRHEINNNAPKKGDSLGYKISVNDCVVKAAAYAMREVPVINSSWSEEGIARYNNVDISIAVATDTGLITPIVRNADQKSLMQISAEIKELVKRAKDNKLKPEEFNGGGFSISNLGMYGIRSFDAIINPPQAAIIAVGAGIEQVIVKDGKFLSATIMNVTLSCDHRVVDGAVAAEFLNVFKKFIENPTLMLI